MKPIRDLRAYGEAFVEAADPTEGGRLAARVLVEPTRAPWFRRVAVVLGSVAIFAGANVGLAFAANPSVPGDPLYGVDLAYERVAQAIGLHPNVAAERFQEAAVLSNRGQFAEAFQTASEAMQHIGAQNSHALEVLSEVAQDAQGMNSEDLPPGLQKQLNDQAQELFGIGQQVSEAAAGTLDLTTFEKRSQQVLDAVRTAMADKGNVPPGLDENNPPGKSGDAPGQSGDTPGQSGDTPPGQTNP